MSVILKNPMKGSTYQTSKDLQADTSWIEQLQPEDIQQLDGTLANLKAQGLSFTNFYREDFSFMLQERPGYHFNVANGEGEHHHAGAAWCTTRVMTSMTPSFQLQKAIGSNQ